jgi:hypothetical protein
MDIDGTVLNFNEAMSQYVGKQGIKFDPKDCITYGYIYENFREYMMKLDFYNELKPFDGVLDSIEKLESKVSVHAFTGSVYDPEIISKRKKLCNDLGFVGGDVYVNGKPYIEDADALFDDNLAEHENWLRHNTKAKLFLIDAPYNREKHKCVINSKDIEVVENGLIVNPSCLNEEMLKRGCIIRCKDLNEAIDLYLKTL